MPETETPNTPVITIVTDSLKTWTIALITITFLVLYALFLVGKIPPENSQYLQPVFLVIVGYYFGRVPSAQVESTLKEQVATHANAAAAARQLEKKAVVGQATLEEKIRNASLTLGKDSNNAAMRILSS